LLWCAFCARRFPRCGRELARKNLAIFLRKDFDAIVTTPPDAAPRSRNTIISFRRKSRVSRAREFSGKVRDVTEFLAALGLTAK